MPNMKYSIKNRPTYFEGRRYVSELEASWAAFFRVREIAFEYEPSLGLATWRPDFQINLASTNILVEVKPYASLGQWQNDLEELEKIDKAHNGEPFQVALLGVGPSMPANFYYGLFPPDPEMDKDTEGMIADFDPIYFGDPAEVIIKWNEARNAVAWKWGK